MKTAKNSIDKVTSLTGSYTSILLHTIVFAGFLLAPVFDIIEFEKALLILTTIVSLEAIYLALFIQMSVNRNTESLENVEEDIQEIQEDVEDISEEVEEIGEDIDEMQEDIEEISEDVEEIEDNLEDLEEDGESEKTIKIEQKIRLEKIEQTLETLLREINNLKK